MKAYGTMGQRLYRLSRGLDSRRVEPDHGMKSVSAETTFNNDLSDANDLVPILRALAEKSRDDLKQVN